MPDSSLTIPLPQGITGIIDAHTHLNAIASGGVDYQDFAPTDPAITAIVERAHRAGVQAMVTVADDLSSAIFAAHSAQVLPYVYAAVALHPMHAHNLNTHTQTQLELLAHQPRVVAIGETGLDWYWANKDPQCANCNQQEESFRWHIDLAKRTHKALMIHNRDADADIIRILDDMGAPDTVIFHCFSSDDSMAQACIERGFYLSISGTVTFKNSHTLRHAVKLIPHDRLLVETDAPFLTPHPYRGKPNEPYCLPYTVKFLADFLDRPAQELASITANNACSAYGIDPESLTQ